MLIFDFTAEDIFDIFEMVTKNNIISGSINQILPKAGARNSIGKKSRINIYKPGEQLPEGEQVYFSVYK